MKGLKTVIWQKMQNRFKLILKKDKQKKIIIIITIIIIINPDH